VNIEKVQRETVLVAQVSNLWCRGFPLRSRRNLARSAGLEVGDTADLEICATMAWMSRRSGLALRRSGLNPTQSNLIRPNPAYDNKNKSTESGDAAFETI
jgi:hypothetical protein